MVSFAILVVVVVSMALVSISVWEYDQAHDSYSGPYVSENLLFFIIDCFFQSFEIQLGTFNE